MLFRSLSIVEVALGFTFVEQLSSDPTKSEIKFRSSEDDQSQNHHLFGGLLIRSSIILLGTLVFSFSARALVEKNEPDLIYKTVSQPTETGLFKFKVIEIDSRLLADQNRISQRVIFEKIGQQDEGDQILSEALRQLGTRDDKSSSPLHRERLEILAEPARAGLWTPVQMNWTQQDEQDYSQWIAQIASESFNNGTNLFADCADVGLLFRWAYAHDKKLPVANTLGGSGKLFGHFSSSAAWERLPTDPDWRKDERFKAAMRYLFDNSFTHTLYDDLYPTQIDPSYVRPGSLYMIIRQKSGHAQTIVKLDQSHAGLLTLWGNEPASEKIFKSWLMWEPAVRNVFGSWRWPFVDRNQWKLTAAQKMPGFSNEQFRKRAELNDDEIFQDWVLSQLALVDFDKAKLNRFLMDLTERLRDRLWVTAIGATICHPRPCDPRSSEADDYSTHSRDARLKKSQDLLLTLIDELGGFNAKIVQDSLSLWSSQLQSPLISGYSLSYGDYVLSRDKMARLSPEANASFQQRWGLEDPSTNKMQYLLLNQQFGIAVDLRLWKLAQAFEACVRKPCEAYFIKLFDTTKIDEGLSTLGEQLDDLSHSPEIANDGAFLDSVKLKTKRSVISLSQENSGILVPSCEIPNACTLYDVLWRPNGFRRIEKWKHSPQESFVSRWDF